MKPSYLLVAILLSTFLSSCASPVPKHEYMSHINQHQGKSKEQLVKELRNKYEEQCLSKDMMGFCVSRLVVVEENHLQTNDGNQVEYYYYRKMPQIQSTVDPPQMTVFWIGQEHDLYVMRFTDQETAYDMMGYLMNIYEHEKN